MEQQSNTKKSGKGTFAIAGSFQPAFNPSFTVETVSAGTSLKVVCKNTVGFDAADILYSTIYLKDGNGNEIKANLDQATFATTATTVDTAILNPSTEWNGFVTVVKTIAGEKVERIVDVCVRNPLLTSTVTFGAQYAIETVANPITFPAAGGSKRIKVSGNVAFVFDGPAWLKFEQSHNAVIVTALMNTTGSTRTAAVVLNNTVGIATTTINFEQA